MFVKTLSRLATGLFIWLLATTTYAAPPVVVLETSQGAIELELFDAEAPATVTNFLQYVDEGFYDGTIFHRVIAGFMIQGGGFDPQMQQKPTRGGIQNESQNGLSNVRGTIAMARTSNPHSATAQFFINTVDNLNLDGSQRRMGYAVFGRVVSGMEVVMKISRVPTQAYQYYRDVPKDAIVIRRAYRKP